MDTQNPRPSVEQAPNTKVTTNSGGGSPKKIIVVLIVLLLLGVGLFAVYSLVLTPTSKQPQSVAPGSDVTDVTEPTSGGTSHYTGSSIVTLTDVAGSGATGIATRRITSGNVFHSINADLPDPVEGEFYKAWILRNSAEVLPLGRMSKGTNQNYTFENNFSFDAANPSFIDFNELHNTIVVSREFLDDNFMETQILQGNFNK